MSTPEPTTPDITSTYDEVMAVRFSGKRSYPKAEVDTFQRKMALALAQVEAARDEALEGWREAHAAAVAAADDLRNATDPGAPLPSRRHAIEVEAQAQEAAELLMAETIAEATLLAQEMLAEAEHEARAEAQRIVDEASVTAVRELEAAHRYGSAVPADDVAEWAEGAQPAEEDRPSDLVDRLSYWENVQRAAEANRLRADQALLELVSEADLAKAEAARKRELASRLDQAAEYVIARLTGAGSTEVQIRPSP